MKVTIENPSVNEATIKRKFFRAFTRMDGKTLETWYRINVEPDDGEPFLCEGKVDEAKLDELQKAIELLITKELDSMEIDFSQSDKDFNKFISATYRDCTGKECEIVFPTM